MQPRTAVIIGATGLIGSHVTDLLLNDNAFNEVRILVRRPVERVDPKLKIEMIDYDNASALQAAIGKGDCIFCCIGTTNKKVKGDDKAYRNVDYDIPLTVAKLAKQAGYSSYLLVSAAGANFQSKNFYLKLKGEVENDIAEENFKSLHIFRPGILYGDRKEFRPGELAGKVIMKAVSFLLAGSLSKYKGIDSLQVAKAMVAAAKDDRQGKFIYHYNEIVKL